MPSANTKNAAGLEIMLHSPADSSNPTASQPSTSTNNTTYRPGSQVTGTVCLTSTSDLSIASVTITLYGRAKVKIVQSNGQSTSEYRSRANFFSYEQRLLDSSGPNGHLCGSGSQTWPFEWTFPSRADAALLRGGNNKKGRAKVRFKPRGESFLSTEGTDKEAAMDERKYSQHIAGHELPPTMQYYHGQYGRQAWGYVEYVLVATVTESGPGSGLFSLSPKKWSSTKVIDFVPDVTQGVITDWVLTSETHHPMIRTSKLLKVATSDLSSCKVSSTGTRGNSLNSDIQTTDSITSAPEVQGLGGSSDGNRILGASRPTSSFFSRLSLSTSNPSSIFSRSSTPRLTLNATVVYPSTIQVAHPNPIPFHLSVAPDLSSTMATSLDPYRLPRILVKTFSFTVVCCTKTRVDQWKVDQKDFKTVNIKLCQNFPVNQIIDLTAPKSLIAESTPSAKRSSNSSKDLSLSNTVSTRSEKSAENSSALIPNPLEWKKQSINLGALASLRLQSAKLGRVQESLLVPSFATYNIARVFGLKYVIEIEILGTGKTEKIKGEVPKGGITVVAAPDSVRDGLTAASELPGYDELDLEGIGGVDDDDAEYEEQAEALQSGKVREAMDEKKGALRERREHEREEGEEELPRYER